MNKDPQIVAAAEDLSDMGRRIAGNAHEPYYCAEKAWVAAKAATRIIARTRVEREGDGYSDTPEDGLETLVEALRREYVDAVSWARCERAQAEAPDRG